MSQAESLRPNRWLPPVWKRVRQNMLGEVCGLDSSRFYQMYSRFPPAAPFFPGRPWYTGRGPPPHFTFGSVDTPVSGGHVQGGSSTLVRVQHRSGGIGLYTRNIHSSSVEVWTNIALAGLCGRCVYTLPLAKRGHNAPGASSVPLAKCRHEGRSVGEVVKGRVHQSEYTLMGGDRSCTPAAYTVCLGMCGHKGPSGACRRSLS